MNKLNSFFSFLFSVRFFFWFIQFCIFRSSFGTRLDSTLNPHADENVKSIAYKYLFTHSGAQRHCTACLLACLLAIRSHRTDGSRIQRQHEQNENKSTESFGIAIAVAAIQPNGIKQRKKNKNKRKKQNSFYFFLAGRGFK